MTSTEPPVPTMPMRMAMHRHPLTVSPNTAIQKAIAQMSQARSSSILIVEGGSLTGIFTERDLVRLIASGTLTEEATIDGVMTREPIALREDRAQDFLTILNIMSQHRIRHLPVVDGRGQLVGLIEHSSLRQALQPSDLMQLRQVEEVMNSQVVRASPETPLLQLVQLMAENSVSCVVVTRADADGAIAPLGIVTERDILQYQNLGLDFRHTPAQTVMSTPLLPISPEDSLWVAHQQMQQYRVRRLVVCNAVGNLAGIITQTSILQAIDPAAIYRRVQVLQKQVERERILSSISLKISQSINIAEILQDTATEVRQWLECDRVFIYRFGPDRSGEVAIEAVSDERWSIHGREVSADPCFPAAKIDLYRQGYPIQVIEDISRSQLAPCYLELMEQLQVRANFVIPILLNIPVEKVRIPPQPPLSEGGDPLPTGFDQVEKTESESNNRLWGLLVAQECSAPRKWQQSEIDLLGEIVTKVAIAIQKYELYHKLQTELAERQRSGAEIRRLNVQLERRVTERTASLELEIRERQLLEQKIRTSEAEFRAFFEAMTDIVLVIDVTENSIKVAPTNPQRFYGETSDVINKTIEQFVDGERAENFYSQIRLALETQEIVNFEYYIQVEESEVWFAANIVPISTDAVTWVARDITDRKRIESALQAAHDLLEVRVAALRESEARFRTMADSAPVLLWVSGTDGLCTFFNQPWLEFTGRTLEQELGNGWTENVHPEDFHYCLDIYLTSFHARKPFQMEYRLQRADGEYRWLLDRAIPRYNADGSFAGYIGSCIDITDRKLAEAERAKLIAIVEATPDFISSSSVDGQVLYFNKAARKILGLGENEEIDNFQISTGHPDWVNDIIQTEGIPTAMRDGSWIGETAILNCDGREVPLSQLIIAHQGTDGKVNMLSTIARDISTLRESERRWRSLLENVRLVVVGLDRAGKVEYVNPFFLELVGYTEAEVLGSDWFATFLPKRDRPQVNEYFWEILERDFEPHYQNIILTKSGEERMIAWNNTRLHDARGKAIGTMSIGEDITERYALERMKDEFISVVSHELRTPLTAIHGGLNLLSSGLVEPQSDRGKRILQITTENSDRLVQLVNDILELERLKSGKIKLSKQQVKAADLMFKATELIQVMANQAEVTISVCSQDIELHADSDRIIQVLTNLLSNAIKFSPKGSTVLLTVQQQSESGESCSACHDSNDSVESHPYCLIPDCSQPILFQVKDRGCGIPADKLESIFERFGQVDASDSRQKGGTGLGLAICRSIIEQHGGQIWAESTLGEGSSFNFTLPRREDHHDQQANSSD
ncbi:MAG: PAS domain S-box protein [Hormoscilla sp.]